MRRDEGRSRLGQREEAQAWLVWMGRPGTVAVHRQRGRMPCGLLGDPAPVRGTMRLLLLGLQGPGQGRGKEREGGDLDADLNSDSTGGMSWPCSRGRGHGV